MNGKNNLEKFMVMMKIKKDLLFTNKMLFSLKNTMITLNKELKLLTLVSMNSWI